MEATMKYMEDTEKQLQETIKKQVIEFFDCLRKAEEVSSEVLKAAFKDKDDFFIHCLMRVPEGHPFIKRLEVSQNRGDESTEFALKFCLVFCCEDLKEHLKDTEYSSLITQYPSLFDGSIKNLDNNSYGTFLFGMNVLLNHHTTLNVLFLWVSQYINEHKNARPSLLFNPGLPGGASDHGLPREEAAETRERSNTI